MQVSVVHFAGCPSWRAAGRRLRAALDEHGRSDIAVAYVPMASGAAAAAAGFRGLPTLLIDGHDRFPSGPMPDGLTCRLYPTATGLAGAPDQADIAAALRERIPS
ncbi:hypothetical protein [Cryptosporangium minutisporangium]|uniref:Thioredoxin family protein n=1 Tax=Cryptosporangium minutisporangium TaxID=113569 RepID=A0ABP6T320_9ACTN